MENEWEDFIQELTPRVPEADQVKLGRLADWIEDILSELDDQTARADKMEELVADYCIEMERERMS